LIYVPEKRNTLLIPSGTFEDPERKHLFVIVTNKGENNSFLAVPVSSIKPDIYYDKTTLLPVGCHSFIRKPSYVLYEKADILKADRLIKCVEGWVYTPREKMPLPQFKAICNGVTVSEHTPQRIIAYFKRNEPDLF